MRAVVTGGAGFLGSHLADLLVSKGWEVLAIDNLITGSERNVAHLAGNGAFRFANADACEPLNVAGEADVVFHFASPASPLDFARFPIEVMRVGSVGTQNALELARAKGARFLMASTSEVYGDPAVHPQPESYWGNVNPIGPRAVYDEAKRFSEAMTMAYRRKYGMETRIVRFFNTYGPRMRLDDGRVVPQFVKQALLGEPLTVHGEGRQTRSFGYCEDIVEGVYRLAMSDYAEPVNIGTHEERTIYQFAETVIRLTGSSSAIVHVESNEDDPKQRHPDLTRANSVLGWYPTTGLEDGLRKTIEYFKGVIAAGG